MQEEMNGFSYTYSVKEREAIKNIRDKYVAKEKSETALEKLHRLDANVMKKAQTASLIFGFLGTLILGLGMSLFMTDLPAKMSMNVDMGLLLGIIIGVVGAILVALAYPMYNLVSKKEREKIAPEILRLTDELLK